MPDFTYEGIPIGLKKLPMPGEEDDDKQHSICSRMCQVPSVLHMLTPCCIGMYKLQIVPE